MKKVLLLVFTVFLFNSCANIFNGVVRKDRCKRCDVINEYNGSVVWTKEGCGSANTRLEEKAKEAAYDLSREDGDLCDLKVECEEWTLEPEEE